MSDSDPLNKQTNTIVREVFITQYVNQTLHLRTALDVSRVKDHTITR